MNDVDEKTEIVNSQVIKGILWRKKTERQEELIMNKKHCYVAVILFSLLVAGIQPVNALHKIPSDTTIGTWDNNPESPTYRTFTLTTDVSQGLEIMESNLILDGGTHTVTGPGSGWGVFLDAKTEVTIRKLTVQNFSLGIYMQENCSEITLEDNTVLNNNTAGIKLWKCNYIYITDNDVSNNSWGIHLWISSNNELTDNDVSDNAGGIWLDGSNDNTLTSNTVTDHDASGIYLSVQSSNNTLTDNTSSSNRDGINLNGVSNNTITGNTASNNQYGIKLVDSSDNTLTNNTVSDNTLYGIWLDPSIDNQINNNNFIGNTTQAYVDDDSIDNNFDGNFWNDWTGPDDDGDGFVDSAYIILQVEEDPPVVLVKDGTPYTVENGWIPNQLPDADAGPDQTGDQAVECVCQGEFGTLVNLDGSGSSDPDPGDTLTYTWTGPFLEGGGAAHGETPTVTLDG